MELTSLVLQESLRKSLTEASEKYHQQLAGSPAEEYLIEERGFTTEVLRFFRIGFVGKAEVGDDIYRGRISIPFLTPSGVVAIQFRSVGPEKANRFLMRGSNKRIYNPSTLLKPWRKVYLCEGPTDTMTVAQLQLPVIGIAGVDNWNSVFARALRNRRVVVLADGDDDGQGLNFAKRVATDVDDCATILFEGMDVNRYRMEYGLDGLKEKIRLD